MTAGWRLGLSLAVCVCIGGAMFVAVDWWGRKPAPVPPASGSDAEREGRIEQLQAAIAAQRAALRRTREQRGAAVDELERMSDELTAVRERLEGLRQRVEQGREAGAE